MAEPSATPSLLRRLRVPLLAVSLPLLVLAFRWGWERSDLDPAPLFPLFMVFQLSVLLMLLVVPLWFYFFSGLSATTKLLGTAGVLLLLGGAVAAIRKVEFNGFMTPVFIFRWEADAQAELDRRLSETGKNASKADLTIGPEDFPRYRGREGDGIIRHLKLASTWSSNPPRILWRFPIGGGYAGFAVAGDSAVTIEQRREQEVISCYDRGTGAQRWAYSYNAAFRQSEPMGGDGPRATPTIHDGAVYSLGALGDLYCLDGATGEKRWHANILDDSKATVMYWGMTSSPLIVGDAVIVNAGINPTSNVAQAIAAYDRKTGTRLWAKGDKPAGYSSALVAELAGVKQIVLFDGGGLVGVDPADGTELWRFPWITYSDMNIMQPVLLPGDRFYISSELSNGGALVQVRKSDKGWSVEQVWKNSFLCSKFSNPVPHGGHLYGLSNGVLTCLEVETGKRCWRERGFGIGQMLLVGDTLLIQTESGELVQVAADPTAYREQGRLEVFSGKTWNTPALAGRHLFLRTHREMVCVELPLASP